VGLEGKRGSWGFATEFHTRCRGMRQMGKKRQEINALLL